MVTIHNILNFINLLIICCVIASTISIWVIITNNYSSLKFIVSLINLCNIGYLITLKFESKYIDDKIQIQNKFYVLTSIIQFYSGLLMLGISTFNIFLGSICILSSIYNFFYAIFNLDVGVEPKREETPFVQASLFVNNTINKTESTESINTITDDDSEINNLT